MTLRDWGGLGDYAFTSGLDGRAIAIRLQRDPVPVVLDVDTLFTRRAGGVEPPVGSVLHPDGDRFILATASGAPGETAAEAAARPVVAAATGLTCRFTARLPSREFTRGLTR